MASSQLDRISLLQQAATRIFNFDENFDVAAFDEFTRSLYHGHGQENEMAKKVLEEFLADERAWCRVDAILEHSGSDESRFYALLILEKLVHSRWKLLPSEQRIGIRDYIVQQVILVGSDSDQVRARKLYLNKLLCLLVEILKHEWPRRWPEFLEEIVQSSKINISIALVNMKILRLLAEEIFQFTSNMNHVKVVFLKNTLITQFPPLFHHIYQILSESTDVDLIVETLKCLHGFLPYVANSYIFETGIIDILIERLFKEPVFTNDTLNNLAEIMLLDSGETDKVRQSIYTKIITQIKTILPMEFDFNLAFSNGTEMQQNFLRMLALFLSQSLKQYHRLYSGNSASLTSINNNTANKSLSSSLNTSQNANSSSLFNSCQNAQNNSQIIDGLSYLISLTKIKDNEIFKICSEFWVQFTANVRIDKSRCESRGDSDVKTLIETFKPILSGLRFIMITNMQRPEEVIIFINEHGEIVRQFMRDTDSINIYNFCKDTLSNLTYLNPEEIRDIIIDRLEAVMKSPVFSWSDLNCLGWAVGSISGAMSVEMERDFVVCVLRCLLTLCDEKSGKDNKAIIASNIMYVVQQYPRFLKPYYRFLKTVVNKLFEFMSETHEGVQDMATDAFLKISRSCKYQLGKNQPDESMSFIEGIMSDIPRMISLLNITQLQTVFEALGQIISAIEDNSLAQRVIITCLSTYHSNWTTFITMLKSSNDIMQGNINYNDFLEKMNNASVFLKICSSMCKSVGPQFDCVISVIFQEGLGMYTMLSNLIAQKLSSFGPTASAYSDVKCMRGVKRDFLNLIVCFITSCHENLDNLKNKYFIPFIGVVLVEYNQSAVVVKEAEVLAATTAFIICMKSRLNENIINVFQMLFDPTMTMISADLQEYPEHRINFFKLIEAIAQCCFCSLVSMSSGEFDFVMQAIFYGIAHSSPAVSSIGLLSLVTIFKNLLDHSYCDEAFSMKFHTTYYIPIFDRILHLVSDGMHQSDLGEHSFLLSHMINLVDNDKIKMPLNEQSGKIVSNKVFVKDHTVQFLKQQHENLTEQQLTLFVNGLFCFYKNHDQFVQHLKDFLVIIKEFQGEEEDDLFTEELKKEIAAVSQTTKPSKSRDDFQYSRSLHDYHTIS